MDNKELKETIFNAQAETKRSFDQNHLQWDTHVLSISILSLGLCLTLLADYIDLDKAHSLYLFECSWILLLSTVVISVVNFALSDIQHQLTGEMYILTLRAINKSTEGDESNTGSKKKHFHDSLEEFSTLRKRENRFVALIRILNHVRTVTFLFGIIFLALFLRFNI